MAGEREFPDLPWGAASDSSLGVDNIVLDLAGEYIFRFPRTEENARQLDKEIRLLPVVNEFVRAPTPKLEFVGKGTGLVVCPFVGYRKIGGVPLAEVPADGGLDSVAAAMDQLLCDLANLPELALRAARVWGDPKKDWREGFLGWFSRWEDLLLPRLPPGVRRRIREDWDAFLTNPDSFAFTPVLLHRDLTPDHILWDGREVCGIIDWGDASVGDPAYDLTGLAFLGKARLDAVAGRRAAVMGDGWRERLAFYRRRLPQIQAVSAIVDRRDPALFERLARDIERSFV